MNDKKKSFLRLVSMFTVLVVLFTGTSMKTSAARDFQAEIDAIEKKIDANNSKKSDQEKSVAELQEDINDMQDQLDVYNDKIGALNEDISAKNQLIGQYEAEITQLEDEINQTNAQIDSLNAKIDETYDLLVERMRASYMAGETSSLEILLGAEDYESFLTRLELVQAISRHDAQVIESLENEIKSLNEMLESITQKKTEQEEKKAAIEAEKAEIVSKRSEVQSSRNEIASKQATMEKKVGQIESVISKLDASTAAYREAIASIQAAEEEYNRQQAALLSQGSGIIEGGDSIGDYPVSSKGMILPLQYSGVVASAWWGSYSGHKGIDLITKGATGNTYGKAIRAAAAGTVVFAGGGSGSSWSYGNFVTIDHGNGVSTRYAHCSSVAVSSGSHVAQGQIIAYVGNTGNVYPRPSSDNPHAGAHLHFEVIINGSRVNPEPWIPAVPHN